MSCNEKSTAMKLLKGGLVVLVAYALVELLPDIKRYIRISMM